MYKTQVQYAGLPDLGQKLQDILMHENLAYGHYLHWQLIVALPVYPWGNLWKKSVSKEMGNLQWILSGKSAAEISQDQTTGSERSLVVDRGKSLKRKS